jgi:hypothetical protein
MIRNAILYVGILIIYFFVHTHFNTSAQVTGHTFYQSIDSPQVYDLLHSVLPDLHKQEWITNVIIGLSMVPLLVKWDSRLVFDFVGLMITIFLIRDITINLTILPKHEKCEMNTGLVSHIIGNCYDKIFSAHFAVVFVLSMLYYSYGYVTWLPGLLAWNIGNALMIIGSRSHYTIDVAVSVLVCLFVYDKNLNFFKLLD